MADSFDLSGPIDALPDTDIPELTGGVPELTAGVQDLMAAPQADLSNALSMSNFSAEPESVLSSIIDGVPADEAAITGEPLSQEEELLQQQQAVEHLQEMLELQQHDAEDVAQDIGGV